MTEVDQSVGRGRTVGDVVRAWASEHGVSDGPVYRRHGEQLVQLAGDAALLHSDVVGPLDELLAELAATEDRLTRATLRVGNPLHLTHPFEPAFVADVAEALLRGPDSNTMWWSAPDLDAVLSAVDSVERRREGHGHVIEQLEERWGEQWRTLATAPTIAALDATRAARSLLLPLRRDHCRADIPACEEFASHTERVLDGMRPSIDAVSEALGTDVSAWRFDELAELQKVADRLRSLPPLPPAWSDASVVNSARAIVQALSDDIRQVVATIAELERRYTPDVWTVDVDPLRGDPTETLRFVSTIGGATDPHADAAKVRFVQGARARMLAHDDLAGDALGSLWRHEDTDVAAARTAVDDADALHRLLAGRFDRGALAGLLEEPASRAALHADLAALNGTFRAWSIDAGRHGHDGLETASVRTVRAWIDDSRVLLPAAAEAFDAVEVLAPHTDRTFGSIIDDIDRARDARIGVDAVTGHAATLLGPSVHATDDLEVVRSRLHWVAEQRVAWRGLPVPEAVGRIIAARAVPDPAPIRQLLSESRALLDRILPLLER